MRADYRRELEQLRRLHEREEFPRNRAQRRAWECRVAAQQKQVARDALPVIGFGGETPEIERARATAWAERHSAEMAQKYNAGFVLDFTVATLCGMGTTPPLPAKNCAPNRSRSETPKNEGSPRC